MIPVNHARYSDRLFVGDLESIKDLKFLTTNDITAAINISGKAVKVADEIDIFSFLLPSEELLDTEIPKTTAKLETIAKTIADLYSGNHNILIYCADGRNKALLTLGFYLIGYQQKPYADVIVEMENIYGTYAKSLTMSSHRKILRLKGGAKK